MAALDILQQTAALAVRNYLGIFLGLPIFYIILNRYFHPLRNIPGPFLASFSKIWLLYHALSGSQHVTEMKAHEKYGPIFRASSNYVLVSDPKYITQMYKWDRSDWFISFDPQPHRSSVGSARPMGRHNFQRRRIANAYSMNSVLEMEHALDKTISEFITKLTTKYSETGKVCNFAEWSHWFAFDSIMSLAFSDTVGFMEKECDVNSLIQSLVTLFSQAQLLATLPILAKIMRSCWYNICFGKKPIPGSPLTGPAAFQAIAKNAVHERANTDISSGPKDLLQRFMMYRDKDGQGIPLPELELEAFSPSVAGPDSTAMALRASVLYVATHQGVHSKMMAEIDEADRAGLLSHPVAYNEVKKLPYFNAVVKECFRVFPPVGTAFPRIVPPEGVTILGHFLPGGTEIGMNFWAISRDKSIYGEDADYFRPERWLESPEKAKLFERYDLNFGAGHCICVGKNIALVEVNKVLLEIFRNFNVSILDPTNPWKLTNILTFVAHDFNIKLSPRATVKAP